MRTTLPGIHRFFVLLLVLVELAVAGCTATPGTSPFETLTEMGVAYADRMPVLIDKSFEVAVTPRFRDADRNTGQSVGSGTSVFACRV